MNRFVQEEFLHRKGGETLEGGAQGCPHPWSVQGRAGWLSGLGDKARLSPRLGSMGWEGFPILGASGVLPFCSTA